MRSASSEWDAPAIVVGGGAAGLAAAGAMGARGLSPLVLDGAGSVGETWRRRYDRLRLNTTRRLSSLPGRTIPRSAGRWVARDDFAAYLADYARERVPGLRLGTEVTGLEPMTDGWRVRSAQAEWTAPCVVVATGFDRRPVMPDWPGAARFEGRLLHAAYYRNASAFVGRRVLVVGAGTSGNEIACDLLEGGAAEVHVAVRNRPTYFPREWLGVPVGAVARAVPDRASRLLDAGGAALERLIFGDVHRAGFPAARFGVATGLRRTGHGVAVDSGLIAAVRDGRIALTPAVCDLDADGAVLADGSRLRVDAVVAATGYRCALDDLLGPIPGALAATGRPRAAGATALGVPGLHAIGFRLPVSGQLPELRRDARSIARLVERRWRAAQRPARTSRWTAAIDARMASSEKRAATS